MCPYSGGGANRATRYGRSNAPSGRRRASVVSHAAGPLEAAATAMDLRLHGVRSGRRRLAPSSNSTVSRGLASARGSWPRRGNAALEAARLTDRRHLRVSEVSSDDDVGRRWRVSVLAVRSFVVRRRRRPAGIGHLVRDRCEVEDPGAATPLAWSSAGASPDAPAGGADRVREERGITLTRRAPGTPARGRRMASSPPSSSSSPRVGHDRGCPAIVGRAREGCAAATQGRG